MSKLILSLDGGGIRGAASIQFLCKVEQKLNAEYGKSIRDCVDFYAGTSTGSILALALATTNMSVDEINNLYSYEMAQLIFTENQGWFELDGINAPKFEASGKTKVLRDSFGASQIRHVPKNKHVLAVSYDIEKRKPVVFKSTKKDHLNLLSSGVADVSSAAPTFFPTKSMITPSGTAWLIDGGVVANNPTMCAIAEAKQAWKDISLSDIRVLSIGTGFMAGKINGEESQIWGGLQWLIKGKLLGILTDERIVAYQAMTIIDQGKYIRVNAKLLPQPGLSEAPDDDMDNVSMENIARLKMLGDFWFNQYGAAAVKLLIGTYEGHSLDRIDGKTGKPILSN